MRTARRHGLLVFLSFVCTACGSGIGTASNYTYQSCMLSVEGYSVCPPSVPLPPGATPPPPPTVVVASQEEFAGVALGTPAAAALLELTARLGQPGSVEEWSCLRPEREDTLDRPLLGQRIMWNSMAAYMTARDPGSLVLSGWSAMPEKNAFSKYDVQLPYNTRLGQSMAEVISKVPEPRSHLAEDVHDGGSLILSTKNSKGLLWLSFDSPGQDVVEEAAFDPEGCR